MNQHHPRSSRKAIAWALLSQSIWLPPILLQTKDELASRVQDYDFHALAQIENKASESGIGGHSLNTTLSILPTPVVPRAKFEENQSGIVLNGPNPVVPVTGSKQMGYTISPIAPSTGNRTSHSVFFPRIDTGAVNRFTPSLSPSPEPVRTGSQRSGDSSLFSPLYSRSDLLGGNLSLRDIHESDMPPMARAERAQWSRSGDPLAPLPQLLREPMRAALQGLATEGLTVDTARMVHVPSSRIKRQQEVPLALQADGTVDILNKPDDPAVIEEIKAWSVRQQLPTKGRMAPAVVKLYPTTETIAPSAATVPAEGMRNVLTPPPSQPAPSPSAEASTSSAIPPSPPAQISQVEVESPTANQTPAPPAAPAPGLSTQVGGNP